MQYGEPQATEAEGQPQNSNDTQGKAKVKIMVTRSNLFLYGAVFAVSAIVGATRFSWLGSYPTATSNDAGNWLTLARIVLGDTWLTAHVNPVWPFGSIEIYNLLTPWLPVLPLAFLVFFLGGETGLKVFMVLTSVLPIPSSFFILRQLKRPTLPCLLVSIVFTLVWPVTTASSWANYGGLIGLSLTLITLALFLRYVERPQRKILFLASLSYAQTAGSDPMFFSFVSVAIAIWICLRIVEGKRPGKLVKPLVGGLALSTIFAPVYIDIFLSRSSHATLLLEPASFLSMLLYNARRQYQVPVLLVGLVVASIVYVLLFVKGEERIVVISTVLSAFLVDYFFFSYRPVRFWYMVVVPAFISSGLFFTVLWSRVSKLNTSYHPRIVRTFALFLLLLLLFNFAQEGYLLTTSSYRFYSDLDAQTLDALHWMRSNIPQRSVILSSPNTPSSPHLDFWISGLAERRAIGEEYAFVPNSPDLTFASEYYDAHMAAMALKGNLLLENGMVMSADGFPYASPFRPLIGMYVGDYQPVGYLAWNRTTLGIVDIKHGSLPSNLSLASFRQTSNFTMAVTQEYASVGYSYLSGTNADPVLYFNETVRYADPTVYLSFSWHGGDARLTTAEIQLYFLVPVTSHTDRMSTTTFSVLDKFGEQVWGSINASSSGGIAEINFVSTGSGYNLASVKFLTGASTTTSFQVAITFHVFRNIQSVSFYTFDSIRNMLHFDYVVIVNRWWYELAFIRTIGTPVYSNEEVTIFRLN